MTGGCSHKGFKQTNSENGVPFFNVAFNSVEKFCFVDWSISPTLTPPWCFFPASIETHMSPFLQLSSPISSLWRNSPSFWTLWTHTNTHTQSPWVSVIVIISQEFRVSLQCSQVSSVILKLDLPLVTHPGCFPEFRHFLLCPSVTSLPRH